jgi:hopanoid biosynthesis associated RND transporter like protein HpnN
MSFVLAAGASYYTATHFAINTNINTLISPHLEWRQRDLAFDKAFPGRNESILAVVNAPTIEMAAAATSALAARLTEQKELFPVVRQLGSGPFFERNGLLFLPTAEVKRTTEGLAQAEQLIAALASDPSLRGITGALTLALAGVQRGQVALDDMVRPLTMSAETLDDVFTGQPAYFSWHALMRGTPPTRSDLRRFIEVQPKLDYAALEPGRVASDAIRKAAADLDLAGKYGARVRLTGPVAIADDEFSTVKEGALLNNTATVLIVLTILWLALRSPKLIVAVFLNLFVGLALTAALGFILVGSLNLISIAFAVLFVGIGVDFGIQFAVRYRAERHELDDIRVALSNTAAEIGAPLTLAAGAVAAGFLSFLPTAYRGVSELGEIAGAGMLIAFATSVTLLPALIAVLNPGGEPAEVGYKSLAPVDRFLERHRIAVVGGTGLIAVLGLPLLYFLTFDFNPMNLRSPKVESVATFLDLRSDPNTNANSINVTAPSVQQAQEVADRLRKIPEVERVMTVQSLVPQDQEPKLAMIKALAETVGPALAEPVDKPPTDAENIEALRDTAAALTKAAGTATGPGATAAKRLAADLTKLAEADTATREKAERAFAEPLKIVLDELRSYLKAEPVSIKTLPPDLLREWVTPEGMTRVEAAPKGDPNDNETIRHFARSILTVFPNAVGGPIAILESGRTIVNAFIQAGAWALIAIAILLWIVLRRFGDVLLTLVPLLLAGVLTLEICVLIGMPLNFANIIALPLLLGVGVAFKIYYIMAWRAGQANLLQTSLTRAVVYSALATSTAFGSLWLSSHPGTSSMGKLLALSLLTTMCAAVLFQPALMGKPRERKG